MILAEGMAAYVRDRDVFSWSRSAKCPHQRMNNSPLSVGGSRKSALCQNWSRVRSLGKATRTVRCHKTSLADYLQGVQVSTGLFPARGIISGLSVR